MAGALEAGYELGALALCFVALALLLAAKDLFGAIAAALNVSILGTHPFASLAHGLENTVIAALDSAIKGVDKVAAKFESGLIDAFGLLIGLPILLGLGVKAALDYLWSSALKPTIHAITNPIRAVADKALARVAALEGAVAANVGAAERYAREHASSALADAKAYALGRVEAIASALRGDIAAAVSAAEGYADLAVARLRAAEDAATASAVALAAEAKVAGEAAGRAALAAAEADLATGLAIEAARRAAELAQLDAAGKAALDVVRSVAVDANEELHTIEGATGALGVAALIAAIPALGTLVHAIATEAGLENAECRSKVKGVCGTDPGAWGDLLAGLALLGIAFNLRELAAVARPAVHGLADVIREAA